MKERNLQAEAIYRQAWEAWKLALTDEERVAQEDIMDSMQPQIADYPKDPRWQAFKDSLEGYNEYWKKILPEKIGRKLNEILRRAKENE